MLTCIDVKFIFDSVRLGLSSCSNILQIACRCFDHPPSCLLAVFSYYTTVFCLVPAVVLTLELLKRVVSAIFIFTTKTGQPCPEVFSVTVP